MVLISKIAVKTIFVRCYAESDIIPNRYCGMRIRSQLGKYLHHAGRKSYNLNFRHEKSKSIDHSKLPSYALSDIPIAYHIEKDSSFDFRILLFGKGIDSYRNFVAALNYGRYFTLGNTPDGKPGKIIISKIEDIWENDIKYSTDIADGYDYIPKRHQYKAISSILLRPVSPLRISKYQTNVHFDENDVTLSVLLRSLISRINKMNHEPIILGYPIKKLVSENFDLDFDEIKIRDMNFDLSNIDFKILPAETEVKDSFFEKEYKNQEPLKLHGGFMNEIMISGELEPILELLFIGEVIHIGRSSSYGLGQYQIEILDNMEYNPENTTIFKKKLSKEMPIYSKIEIEKYLTKERIGKAIGDFKKGEYAIKPAIKFKLSSGRTISLIDPLDKLFEMHVNLYLQKFIDNYHQDNIYAFRRNKGAIKAIKRIVHEIKQKDLRFAVKLDIDKYFDNIDREHLLIKLQNHHFPQKLLRFIELCTNRGWLNKKHRWIDSDKGIPQGAVISPALSNLYLRKLDCFVTERIPEVFYIRYCDDLIFLSSHKGYLQNLIRILPDYLDKTCSLSFNKVNPIKNIIEDSIEYLGISINRKRLNISDEKYSEKLNEIEKIIYSNADNYQKAAQEIKEKFERWEAYYGKILGKDWCKIISNIIQDIKKKNIGKYLDEIANILKEELNLKEEIKAQVSEYTKPSKLSVKELIKQSKVDYYEKLSENSTIIIDTEKTFLGKSGLKLFIDCHGRKLRIPLIKIRRIVISARWGVTISSSLIKTLAKEKVSTTFLGFDGQPYAYISSPERKQFNILAEQMKSRMDIRGFEIAKNIIIAKMKNQMHLIKYWRKSKKRKKLFDKYAKAIIELIKEAKSLGFNQDFDYAQKLMQLEAEAAANYWKAFAMVIKKYDFQKRNRRGAKDPINCLLNYGYGFLRNHVNAALSTQGFDLTVSFLHKQFRNKPTLVFDIMEQFRQPFIDREIVALANKGKKIEIENGLLSDDSRKYLLKRLVKRFADAHELDGKIMTNSDIIDQNAEDLYHYILGKKESYSAYVFSKW